MNGSVITDGEGQREKGLQEKIGVCFSDMINLKCLWYKEEGITSNSWESELRGEDWGQT